MAVALANSDTDEDLERYLKCFRLGEPTFDFVPALEGDAPIGCTLQAVVLTGSVTSKIDGRYDNALAGTINGLYKAALIHRRAPW